MTSHDELTESPPSGDDLDLDEGLRRLGFETFRPGQREAIQTLTDVGRLLLVAPTGGGKSLTYQLPATLLPGTSLVISPLVALMHDQVAALQARGVSATYLASTLDGGELRQRMAGVAAGQYDLVYVAPERLMFGGFRATLSGLNVPLVAIDEAHCISEWGHDFRPEYLQIGTFLADLRPPRVLACTATATPIVRDEILSRLGLPPDTPQQVQGFARPNVALRVAEIRKAKDREALVDRTLAEALGGPGQNRGTAIIYAPTRKHTQQHAARLEKLGWKAAAYHAGMTGSQRDRVQQRFITDRLEVVVATNAFGMGIDRADVRAVIHLAPPGSVEAYYQEVGRAGRDDAPAIGLMMLATNDMPLRRRLLERDNDGVLPDPAVVEHKWNLFLELIRWAEGGTCRQAAILRYFGDRDAMDRCGVCDVCCSLGSDGVTDDPEEVTLIVRKALSGVARVHRRFGLRAAVKLLAGSPDPRLSRTGLDKIRTFGVLSEFDEAWILKLLQRCITAGWIDFFGDEHPVVFLTDEGQSVMKGQRPARLLLPPRDHPLHVPGRARKPKGPAEPGLELDPAGVETFEALRQHRLEVARDLAVPPYVVASDRTLREIAMLRPQSLDQLGMVHGIGPAKLEKYGDGLLAVVKQAAEPVQESP